MKAMMELTRINDPRLFSWLMAKLKAADIEAKEADGQSGIKEGAKGGSLPRIMVDEKDFTRARQIIEEIWNSDSDELPELTDDALLGGRVKLRQLAKGYRAAIDPVLLAAAVNAHQSHLVLDAGSNMGAAALCVASRVQGACVTGIELDGFLVELAKHNALANDLDGHVNFIQGDILDNALPLTPASFDHVMANPPYRKSGAGNVSLDLIKAASNVEGAAVLSDWILFCVKMARPKGFVTIIHHASRLDEILSNMHGRLGEIVVFPLWPDRAGKPAKRIIIKGRKGARGALRMARGLTLHDDDGNYTPEAIAILRHGAPLVI